MREVGLVVALGDHVHKSHTEIWVIERAILELEFETCVESDKQRGFPTYINKNNRTSKREYKNKGMVSYSLASASTPMLRPGCGHAGHSTAILPSAGD